MNKKKKKTIVIYSVIAALKTKPRILRNSEDAGLIKLGNRSSREAWNGGRHRRRILFFFPLSKKRQKKGIVTFLGLQLEIMRTMF